jgi:hypothetical protein
MHIPRKICIYCLFITYVWCITANVSMVFTDIFFEEAGHAGSASKISDVFLESIFINYNW